MPFLLGLLGIVAVSAGAWVALGRLAALLCAVVLAGASEALRGVLYVPESHGLIVLHAGVLCGSLLAVYRRALADRLTARSMAFGGLLLAIFTGAGLTDQLLYVSGLAPFVLAPAVCWLLLRTPASRAVAIFALAAGALSVVVALSLTHVMQDMGVIHAPFPIYFVRSEEIFTGLQNLLAALTSLGGGSFFGTPVAGVNLLTLIAGALVVTALVAILRVLWRWAAIVGRPPELPVSQNGLRALFISYWGLTLLCVLAAVALTNLSENGAAGRYLIGAWVAMAALLGTLATTPGTKTVVTLGVLLVGLINMRSQLSGVPAFGPSPEQRVAGAIEHFVRANGASVGYGGYWDAAPVTWETHMKVKVYPVEPCSFQSGACSFYNNTIDTWYRSRGKVRTFLLTDNRPGIPLALGSPLASLGQPLTQAAVGEGLTAYIYDYDIARNLGP
jgi:hypothetical protein